MGEVGELTRKDGNSVTVRGVSNELRTFAGVGRSLAVGDEVAIPDTHQEPFEIGLLYRSGMIQRVNKDSIITTQDERITVVGLLALRLQEHPPRIVSLQELDALQQNAPYRVCYSRRRRNDHDWECRVVWVEPT